MNKRLVTLIILLVVVVVVLIVNFTVLTVREVSVDFQGESSGYTESQILDAADVGFGKNIFGVSELEVVTKIQTAYPAVKVISVERKFPDTIVIHTAVRYPILAILVGSSSYALIDREFSVIEVVDRAAFDTAVENGQRTAVAHTNVSVVEANAVAGAPLLDTKATDILVLQNVVVALENSSVLNADFVSLVSAVNYSHTNGVSITFRSGVIAEISDIANISLRVGEAYSWYLSMASSSDSSDAVRTTSGYIRYDTLSKKFVWSID